MPSTVSAQTRAHHLRQRALAPYLSRIDLDFEAPPGEAATGLEIAGDRWIRSQLKQALLSGDEAVAGAEGLVAHGCALLVKCGSDLASITEVAQCTDQRLYAVQAELMFDAALGMALLRELQSAVDQAIQVGELSEAKKLAEFGHRLRRTVSEVKRRMAETESGRAEQLSDQFTDRPREDRPVAGSPERSAPEVPLAPRPGRRRRTRSATGSPARRPPATELLVAALAASILFWGAAVKLPELLGKGPYPIGRGDFSDEAVLSVVARYPSLYIVVEQAGWNEIDPPQRQELVERLSSAPMSHDYLGALIRTSDGRPVAAWSKANGVRLLDGPEESDSGVAEGSVAVFVP